ncbi:MAG: MBL fold metallo-hydrolase [Candidatus Cloacimonetes bacterium]|nr:MBL fold metallo-hydrolase [Candidatus Cloacimonadota bacterium]
MFQLGIIASGSKGNCLLVRGNEGAILLDAGLTGKKIAEGLDQLKIETAELKALIISHEHSDHIRGAGIVCRKYQIPLYITRETYACSAGKFGNLPAGIKFFEPGKTFRINDLIIIPFASSHDAVESSNFKILQDGNSNSQLGVATDCGYFTRLMKERLMECTTLVLESNHDEIALINGPYRWDLKQRVKSRQGHLSNHQAVSVVSQIIHPGMKRLILAHLSEQNNTPELAYEEMRKFLAEIQHELELQVASQYQVLPLQDI